MAMFQFGERKTAVGFDGRPKEVGTFALHVQCRWRIVREDRVLVGSRDINYPADYSIGQEIPDDFDWDRDRTRLDRLIDELFEAGARSFVVQQVKAGLAGGLHLDLSDNLTLELFPDDSAHEEDWRLFRPGSNEPNRTLLSRTSAISSRYILAATARKGFSQSYFFDRGDFRLWQHLRWLCNNQAMEIPAWDERYRSGAHAASDFNTEPSPLLVATVSSLPPGNALDLASGTGRNALWLAEHGWKVTAVDGSAAAIEALRKRADERHVAIDARVANLERHEFAIAPSAWDLIAVCYYLQRDLFELVKAGVVPGGILIAIVHITEPSEEPTGHRLRPGELKIFFDGWEILHYAEGKPNDPVHERACAEVVARRLH